MRINTNVHSLNGQRQVGVVSSGFSKSVEKLAAGRRINRAGDDAAGLSISENTRGQIRGLNQASRNAQDGISLVQTAEGAMNEVHSILERARELAVQGSNDTLTTTDRGAIGAELAALTAKIDNIATNTQVNTQKLIDGSYAGKIFQIGADAGETITMSIADARTTALAGGFGAAATAFTAGPTQGTASALITATDAALVGVSTERSNPGAIQNRWEHTIANLNVASENVSASESRIRDVDMALETVSFTRSQNLRQAGTAELAQANQAPQGVLSLLR